MSAITGFFRTALHQEPIIMWSCMISAVGKQQKEVLLLFAFRAGCLLQALLQVWLCHLWCLLSGIRFQKLM